MDNTTNSLAEKSRLRQMIDSYGVPRMIITGFLLLMFVLVPFAGVDFATQISNVINRFSWNAIMVLAMVPMVHSGCGLNFGLPLGIISGLLGATLSIELGFTGPMSFVMAIAIATPFALLLGGGYGWLLNKIKGGEMMVATYVGFSSVSFMCMMWLLLPYKKPEMVWGFSGSGLRTTISLEGFYDRVLADILSIDLNRFGMCVFSRNNRTSGMSGKPVIFLRVPIMRSKNIHFFRKPFFRTPRQQYRTSGIKCLDQFYRNHVQRGQRIFVTY